MLVVAIHTEYTWSLREPEWIDRKKDLRRGQPVFILQDDEAGKQDGADKLR